MKGKYPIFPHFFWSGQNNFESDLATNEQKTSRFPMLFKFFLILPSVWLSNLGSDLLIEYIVRLDSADTKCDSQDVVKNCYLQKSENTETSEVNSKLFKEICWKHSTPLQLLGIHCSSTFYSTLLSFFVLKMFGFNWASLLVKYFGSISRFERFVQPWSPILVNFTN